MNTTLSRHPGTAPAPPPRPWAGDTPDAPAPPARPAPAWRRVVDVVARPQSYRNIAYLLLGLPLGTAWFAVLVTAVSTSVSLLVVALLGIPLLLATWYAVRAFADIERFVAGVLLGEHLPAAPLPSGHRGNLWVRLKAMSAERDRWRELGFLALRFPAGVATFTVAVTAMTVPFVVAYAPIEARRVDEPFGNWFWSGELERAAGSGWGWLLVPVGAGLLLAGFHLVNGVARLCGRWAAAWLGPAARDETR